MFNLLGILVWVYLMKVIPETHHMHYIRYLRVYCLTAVALEHVECRKKDDDQDL